MKMKNGYEINIYTWYKSTWNRSQVIVSDIVRFRCMEVGLDGALFDIFVNGLPSARRYFTAAEIAVRELIEI